MPLPLVIVAFLAVAIAENRAANAKPAEPIVLRAGQTLLVDDDGWRVIEGPLEMPAEPSLPIPPAPVDERAAIWPGWEADDVR